MSQFKVNQRGGILHLEFYAPASYNALSLESARELAQIQKNFKKWRGCVVVSSGHPSMFCSGGNLSDYKKLKGKDQGLKVNREICKHLDAFGKWPVVKLALIEGDVLGGGMEWLARFDFRWSTPAAFFAFWQRRIGLSTGWGGGKVWSDKIGEARVKQLLFETRLLSAAESMRHGLVDRVISGWKIHEEALQWAERLTGVSMAIAKWSVLNEDRTFTALWDSPGHRSALEKWKGR